MNEQHRDAFDRLVCDIVAATDPELMSLSEALIFLEALQSKIEARIYDMTNTIGEL